MASPTSGFTLSALPQPLSFPTNLGTFDVGQTQQAHANALKNVAATNLLAPQVRAQQAQLAYQQAKAEQMGRILSPEEEALVSQFRQQKAQSTLGQTIAEAQLPNAAELAKRQQALGMTTTETQQKVAEAVAPGAPKLATTQQAGQQALAELTGKVSKFPIAPGFDFAYTADSSGRIVPLTGANALMKDIYEKQVKDVDISYGEPVEVSPGVYVQKETAQLTDNLGRPAGKATERNVLYDPNNPGQNRKIPASLYRPVSGEQPIQPSPATQPATTVAPVAAPVPAISPALAATPSTVRSALETFNAPYAGTSTALGSVPATASGLALSATAKPEAPAIQEKPVSATEPSPVRDMKAIKEIPEIEPAFGYNAPNQPMTMEGLLTAQKGKQVEIPWMNGKVVSENSPVGKFQKEMEEKAASAVSGIKRTDATQKVYDKFAVELDAEGKDIDAKRAALTSLKNAAQDYVNGPIEPGGLLSKIPDSVLVPLGFKTRQQFLNAAYELVNELGKHTNFRAIGIIDLIKKTKPTESDSAQEIARKLNYYTSLIERGFEAHRGSLEAFDRGINPNSIRSMADRNFRGMGANDYENWAFNNVQFSDPSKINAQDVDAVKWILDPKNYRDPNYLPTYEVLKKKGISLP